jgi:hypothetical protein
MTKEAPATKADIERVEVKLDHILRAMGEVFEALEKLQRQNELEAADWNKAVPPAGRLDEIDEGGGI